MKRAWQGHQGHSIKTEQVVLSHPSKHVPFTVAVCSIPTYALLENRPAVFIHKWKLGLSLGWEGCSHLEWIPHAAQQEADLFFYCSVSSTLHQGCFVCHRVIKVAHCNAVSGVVVLKLGQQGLSLRKTCIPGVPTNWRYLQRYLLCLSPDSIERMALQCTSWPFYLATGGK